MGLSKVEIDLEEYGGKGMLVMGLPGRGRQLRFYSMAQKYIPVENGKPRPDKGDNIMITVLDILMHVEEAPFAVNVDSFLDYLDRLDAKSYGMGEALNNRMQEVAASLDKGAESPLAGSPGAETTVSE